MFSIRDEQDHSFEVPAAQLRDATRIFEMGPGTLDWEEIDYAETNYFVDAAENFDLEVVFALDFTNSMALGQLPDGRSGIQAMLDAFEETVISMPEAHRIGVVEFHDRNVELAVLSDLTTDRDAILESVAAFAASPFDPGSSRVWDSIHTASTLFTSREDNPTLVRALVFISDGRDTSSDRDRADAATTAGTGDIQLYALGIGDVFEEEQLEELVRVTGGVYYPTKELAALQDQLQVLVGDLRGQYRLSYITLRREGSYQTRVEIDLPGAVGVFESSPIDVGEFFGPDIEGRIVFDPPSVDTSAGRGYVFIRAIAVPRNIDRFRFRLETLKPVSLAVVAAVNGGLLEGWEISERDPDGYYDVTGPEPIEFGSSGLLFLISISNFTEKRLEVPIVFDNRVYTANKSFTHPPAIFLGQRIPAAGRIAFRSNRDGNFEIYVMNFDGTGQRNLTKSAADEFLATWSPQGQQLAFDTERNLNREIYVTDDQGADSSNLTNSAADEILPAWSPDGQFIAFSSDRDGNREIYIMDAADPAQPPTRLTNNPAEDWWPTWSPDGSQIAFVSNRDGNHEIYAINVSSTVETNLTNDPAGDFRPAWSPDGLSIAFYIVFATAIARST